MATILRRQLDDHEQWQVLAQHGRVCYATGHGIPDETAIQFDHIRAFATGGVTEINNIAPMCSYHNQQKGTLPLFDFRAKLRLEEFFGLADRLTLGDLLEHLHKQGEISSYGMPVVVHLDDGTITLESATFGQTFKVNHCPTTNWQYFYATLPFDLLDSDDDSDQAMGLQPRYLILDKVFDLFRHFQTSPVLQPSLGRLVDGKIRLFDGQHKAAAILWNDRRELECKIYLDPDLRLLNQTNISAHEKFAQTRFFTSIMVMKLGTQFGADFDQYKNLEDGKVKSESGFLDYLVAKDNLTKGEVTKRLRSFLYHSVVNDDDNQLNERISLSNRRTEEKPITLNMLEQSLFGCFLHRQPVGDNMTTDAYKRGSETKNLVTLMNIIHEMASSQWDPKAPASNEVKLKIERILRARFMRAWSELLRDAICVRLSLHDSDEWSKPFYRELNDADWKEIRYCVRRLVDWKMWSAPANTEIDQIRSDSYPIVKDWLRDKGLTTGYLMGAPA